MPVVEKGKDGVYFLGTRKGKYKKTSRLPERLRTTFFVTTGYTFIYKKKKKKFYKYGRVVLGDVLVRIPKELIGRHIRFVCQRQDDVGDWE